jgi:hypothetical protein
METSNLLVEAPFIASVLADHDGEDRLVRLAGNALRGRPIGVPNRLLVTRLRGQKRSAARQADEQGHLRFHKKSSPLDQFTACRHPLLAENGKLMAES